MQVLHELIARVEPAGRHGQHLRQLVNQTHMFAEDFLRLHAQSHARKLGSDERIAIAVAANP